MNAVFTLELCAGCARLSASLATKGFKAMAVDQKANKHKQCYATVALDLANEEALQLLKSLLKPPGRVFYVHAAPPCGTCSKARDRKLKWAIRRLGVKEPKPLRSALHPHGLPSLRGLDLKRVTLANRIYANIALLLKQAIRAGAFVSIENPTRSWMWQTQWMLELIDEFSLFPVTFQQCMHGGKRDKWSTFYTNAEWLLPLAKECDGSHVHAPWGITKDGIKYKFNTAEEAEYPPVLCQRIAAAVHSAALSAGIQVVSQPNVVAPKAPPTKMAAAGRQPRGHRLPEVISEYKSTLFVSWPFSKPTKLPRFLSADEAAHLGVPSLTKVLTCESRKSADVEDPNNGVKWSAKLGILRTALEFVEEAVQLSHPFDSSSAVTDDAKWNIFAVLVDGPEAVLRRRREALSHYAKRAVALQLEEDKLHEQLPEHRQKLVADKRTLLLAEMCRDAGVPDNGLLELQLAGTPLTGVSGSTGLFEDAEACQPAMDDVQLMKSSRWSRKMVAGRESNTMDMELNKDVWEITMKEVEKGWLQGPLSDSQVKSLVGPLYVVSPRFGLRQSDKVRPIDDMSISLVNSSFAASYSLELDGVDGIAVLARTMAGAVTDDGRVSLKLSDGSSLEGSLHFSLDVTAARTILGRTLDLDSAYKQLLVRQSSLWSSVLQVRDCAGQPHLFLSQVLPFGASAAVYSFNRFSKALQIIGSRLFSLTWTCYFDDFTQFDLAALGDSSQTTAEGFLDLVGWKFSMKDTKRCPMAASFSVLGVTVDLSASKSGIVVVRNKESRVLQIKQEIAEIIRSGSFSTAVASSLRGRLQFAESQTFGRAINLFMRACNSRAANTSPGTSLDENILGELRWAQCFIEDDRPRILKVDQSRVKVVIFTDACLEEGDTRAGVGMVAYVCKDQVPVKRYFFADEVPKEVLEKLQETTPKVISGLELMAAVMAIVLMKDHLLARRAFLFVDNEAARASLISMWSPVVTHAKLLRQLWDVIRTNSIFMWTSRVPSASNIADRPSRFEFVQLLQAGFVRLYPKWL